MLNQIRKSKNFQEEYNKFSKVLESMPEGKFKDEYSKLLNKLVSEVRKLDDMHTEMIYTHQLSSMGSDFKETILSIRKQLEAKLKDYNQSIR